MQRSQFAFKLGIPSLAIKALLIANGLWAEPVDIMLTPVENPQTITFKEAINLALSKSPAIKKAEQTVIIAESDSLTAISKLMPKIGVKAGSSFFPRESSSELFADSNVSLNAIIPLFDAKILMDLKAKREAFLSANDKYSFEQDSLINEVGQLYMEALTAQATKDNANEQREVYKRQLLQIEKRAKVGAARSLDVTRAEYLANKADTDYLLSNQEFHKRMGELGQQIGIENFFLVTMVEILSPNLSKNRDELLAMALKSSDIKSAQKIVASAQYSLWSEKLDLLPKLNAGIDAGYLPDHERRGLLNQRDFSWRMVFNIELPLFSGGSSLLAIRSKSANKTIEELMLQQKNSDKLLSVNGLLRQINDLIVAKNSAHLALDAATKAKESAERLFAIEEATGIELTEASTNHFNAKNQLINASLKLEQTKLRLLFVVGTVRELL